MLFALLTGSESETVLRPSRKTLLKTPNKHHRRCSLYSPVNKKTDTSHAQARCLHICHTGKKAIDNHPMRSLTGVETNPRRRVILPFHFPRLKNAKLYDVVSSWLSVCTDIASTGLGAEARMRRHRVGYVRIGAVGIGSLVCTTSSGHVHRWLSASSGSCINRRVR